MLHKNEKPLKAPTLPQKMATKPNSTCRSSWKRCRTNCKLKRGKLRRLYVFPIPAHCFITHLYLAHQGHSASPKHILQEAHVQFLLMAPPGTWPTVDLHAQETVIQKRALVSTKDYSPLPFLQPLPALKYSL